MRQITKCEREIILAQYPKAEIVRTRHRAYLAGRDTDIPGRILLKMRGITPPPSRRELRNRK